MRQSQHVTSREKYIAELFARSPQGDEASVIAAQTIGKHEIQVGGMEAQILRFLIHSIQAKRALEIGTCTGRSSLWIADALGLQGHLTTIEKDPAIAQLAEQVFRSSSYSQRIELLVGDARQVLPTLGDTHFDFIFIDANKLAYLEYLEWAIEHLSVGGLIAADNTFLFGDVLNPPESNRSSEKQRRVMQQFNERLAVHQSFTSVMLPTTEGLTLALKLPI